MSDNEIKDKISLNGIDYNIGEMVSEIAKEQAKRFDDFVLKSLQEKFNTDETDPIKLKQMLDDANLEMSVEKISEEVEEVEKCSKEWAYKVKTVFVPVFKKKANMKIELYYKDKIYTLEQEEDWDVIYNYTEGNFSCDCNRGIMIGEELDCNQNGQNEIKIKIYDDNGEIVYDELEKE